MRLWSWGLLCCGKESDRRTAIDDRAIGSQRVRTGCLAVPGLECDERASRDTT